MTKNVDNYCSFLVKFLYAGHKVGLVFSETKKPILKSTVFRLCLHGLNLLKKGTIFCLTDVPQGRLAS